MPMGQGRRLWIVVGLGAVLILSGAVDRVSDAVFNPWARATPPLLGEWVGRLIAADGAPLIIGLELRRGIAGRGIPCIACNQLEGTAAICDARGVERQYAAAGAPEDRHARRLQFGVEPLELPPPNGPELHVLRGDWNGQDELSLELEFIWRGPAPESSTIDDETRPATAQLERKAWREFRVLCAGLRTS